MPLSPSTLFPTSSWDPPLHGQALANCRPKPETRDCDWAPLPSSPETLLWGKPKSPIDATTHPRETREAPAPLLCSRLARKQAAGKSCLPPRC